MTESKPLKILIIGDSAVGKTSLLFRYTEDKFDPTCMATIGVDYKIKILNIEDNEIKLQIWDTAGAEKFRSITKTYYRGACGVVLLFDVSERRTFDQVKNWLNSIREGDQSVPIVLVGNKCDLNSVILPGEAEKLANQYHVNYFQTSAKENININETFEYIAVEAFHFSNTVNVQQSQDITDENPIKKSCIC